MHNLSELLHLATDAAIRAGEAIMEVYTSPTVDWEVERKADNSPLTLADRRSHAVIAPVLEATGIPVLSEEGAHLPYEAADGIAEHGRKSWSTLWVVDPLDGTKEFIKRNGEFTVNIALVEDGVPVLGVIYVPVTRDLYVGSPAGAFKGTVPAGTYSLDAIRMDAIRAKAAALSAPGAAALSSAERRGEDFVVVASRSHLSPETQEYIDALRAEHPDLTMVSAGSSLKLCLVAEGKADVYPRFAPTMEWDTAAGHAICRAAGCEVYRVDAAVFRNQLRNSTGVSPDSSTGVSLDSDAGLSPDPDAALSLDSGAGLSPLVYNKPDLLNPWFIVK